MKPTFPLQHRLARRAEALFPEVQRLRRDFHQHPELSNQEARTGRVAGEYLAALGLTVTTGVAGHGVVADLVCPHPGPTLAYRADMDALPIQEKPGQPWCSRHPGVMHACGHDVHLAIALGAAKLLSEFKDSLAGRFRFILQPAEEGLPPGTVGGAELMVQQGVLADPPVAAIMALHVAPRLEVGRLGFCPDIVMAGAEQLRLEILGRQAHAATPHHGVDAIVVTAQALTLLQSVLSQGKDARQPAVLTFGTIAGGSRFNILADQVALEGTLRYHDLKVREGVLGRVHRLLEGLCAGAGARYRLESQSLYPILVNDPDLTRVALDILRPLFGPQGLVQLRPVLGSEDFACYAQKIPGFYFFLGTRSPDGEDQTLHSPDFDPDEQALTVGLTAAAALLTGLSREGAQAAAAK
ncbi:MAG: amidohydrolase [Deltaproteobacteria bacterium]|nr:amidohydrolase [Deltaproteobacteria bacterium]